MQAGLAKAEAREEWDRLEARLLRVEDAVKRAETPSSANASSTPDAFEIPAGKTIDALRSQMS